MSGFTITPPSRESSQNYQLAPIYVKNEAAEEIPAYACLQITGSVDYNGQNFVKVDKPVDVTGASGWYLFNGMAPIEASGRGIAHDGPLVRMLTSGATITCGDRWRPTIGQWYVTPSTSGIFSAIGADDIGTNIMRGLIMGLAACTNPVNDVYLDGLSLKLERCDGTVETIYTGTEC